MAARNCSCDEDTSYPEASNSLFGSEPDLQQPNAQSIPQTHIMRDPGCGGFGEDNNKAAFPHLHGNVQSSLHSRNEPLQALADVSNLKQSPTMKLSGCDHRQGRLSGGNTRIVPLTLPPAQSEAAVGPSSLATQPQFHLMRPVYPVEGALRAVQQSTTAHITVIQPVLTHFYQRIDSLAHLLQKPGHSWLEKKQSFVNQAFSRVTELQMVIEQCVGRFSAQDHAYINRLPSFEDKLLAVMHIGLTRQELHCSGQYGNADGRIVVDVIFSCVLEARKWQVEMLWAWVRQLDKEIQAMSMHTF